MDGRLRKEQELKIKMKKIRVFVTLFLGLLFAGTVDAEVVRDDEIIRLKNLSVVRTLKKSGGAWRTVSFSRADGSDKIDVESDEFLIKLLDGAELTVNDYLTVASEQPYQPDQIVIEYTRKEDTPTSAPKSVTITYSLADEPYLRKSITLTMEAGGAVDRLEVERFTTNLSCDRGGRGEPVFVGDSWFFGLEYPGSHTGCVGGLVSLAHFPGLAKAPLTEDGEWLIESKTAVAGVAAEGDPLELAFSDYLDSIRRPSHNFLHYNSWYDWRGDEINFDNLMATFEAFKKNLLDPYGLKMDAFALDDGWQNKNSIWVPKKHLYPKGFAPLASALKAKGSRLGLWMALNGYNLNVRWGAARGLEVATRPWNLRKNSWFREYYCLVGPNYNGEIRRTIKRLITEGNVGYFKHDFNRLQCLGEGHGHLPDLAHGHEANLDAQLDLMAYERQLRPDVFLNVTSDVWHSPWWLMHADTVWMDAQDFGYDKTIPQLSPREWAMSYRDAHIYGITVKEQHLVPISAYMTGGIIHGKKNKLGGEEETLREWADYVTMYYARGVQLKELYITPDMLEPEWWKVLGETTRWAIDNRKVLEKVVFVGGNAKLAEPYAYVHWLGDKGIIAVRNPDLRERKITIPFDKTVKYRGKPGREFRGRVIYPFVEPMGRTFVSGSEIDFQIPGSTVMIFEIEPGQASQYEPYSLPNRIQTFASVSKENPSVRVDVDIPDEDMQRCDLYFVVFGGGRILQDSEITLDGQSVQSRLGNGDNWSIRTVDLRNRRGKKAEIEVQFPAAKRLFARLRFDLNVWIVADRPVMSKAAPDEHLPYAISQNFRRETSEVLPRTAIEQKRKSVSVSLTDEDLKSVKSARLRIRVFDSHSGRKQGNKFILLNGITIARVPSNTQTFNDWEEFVIDLDVSQLVLLKLENIIRLDNAGEDYFKFSSLTLAIQIQDDQWVESSSDETVYTSHADWEHAEGEPFIDNKSPEIRLSF